jgi:hypothetical protein
MQEQLNTILTSSLQHLRDMASFPVPIPPKLKSTTMTLINKK